MSVERSFEAWEEVQRHGQDLADRLAQGFTGLIQSHISPPSFPWPNPQNSKLFDLEFPSQTFGSRDFGLVTDSSGLNGVSAILDIGNRIGQAGADFGAGLNGLVQQFFRRLPVPFRPEENAVAVARVDVEGSRLRSDVGATAQGDIGSLSARLRDLGFAEDDSGADGSLDDEVAGFNLRTAGLLGRPQVRVFETIYLNSFIIFCNGCACDIFKC
jgi:hypothetical protein